jgi:hypothetical protein
MTLLVVRGDIRLGTFGFFPGPITGWKEGFEVSNSRRTFVC